MFFWCIFPSYRNNMFIQVIDICYRPSSRSWIVQDLPESPCPPSLPLPHPRPFSVSKQPPCDPSACTTLQRSQDINFYTPPLSGSPGMRPPCYSTSRLFLLPQHSSGLPLTLPPSLFDKQTSSMLCTSFSYQPSSSMAQERNDRSGALGLDEMLDVVPWCVCMLPCQCLLVVDYILHVLYI